MLIVESSGYQIVSKCQTLPTFRRTFLFPSESNSTLFSVSTRLQIIEVSGPDMGCFIRVS